MKGRVQVETISSLVLRDNPLGDPRRREVPVYLPPSHGRARGRRYPVLYFLHGFGGTGRGALNHDPWRETLPERLDRLIAAGRAREAILVLPDGHTAYGGSQWIDSPATGRYGAHLAEEVTAFVDDKFSTVRGPAGRAVFGVSSGGFGALAAAMERPGVFGHAAAHSGDMGFDLCYAPDFPKCVPELDARGGRLERWVRDFRAARDKSAFDRGAVNIMAMASCYSPAPGGAGFELPFDARTAELKPAVWRRWLAWDPARAAGRRAEALRRLETLWFDAGRRDEFRLHLGARRLSARLKALGARHSYEEHDGGHFDLRGRYDRTLALLTRRCARAG